MGERSRQITANPASAWIRNTRKLTLTVRAHVDRHSTRAMATAMTTTTSVAVITMAATAVVPTSRKHTVKSASAKIQITKNRPPMASVTGSAARRSTKATASVTITTTIAAVVMTVVTAALVQSREEKSTRITANSASVLTRRQSKRPLWILIVWRR